MGDYTEWMIAVDLQKNCPAFAGYWLSSYKDQVPTLIVMQRGSWMPLRPESLSLDGLGEWYEHTLKEAARNASKD